MSFETLIDIHINVGHHPEYSATMPSTLSTLSKSWSLSLEMSSSEINQNEEEEAK